MGVSGITLIALGKIPAGNPSGNTVAGVLLLSLSNIASATGNILIKKDNSEVPPLILNSFQLMTGGLLLFLLSLPTEGLHFQTKPAEYYLSLTWLTLMSATAFSIWFTLLKRPGVKVSVLNVWKFIIPGAGAILSWIFIPDDKPVPESIIGIIVVALSIVILFEKKRKNTRKA